MMNEDANSTIALFQHKCRSNNLKITPQRTAIYRELIQSKDHPSAGIIFNKIRKIFPDISFDTVNRTLLTFNKIGIVSMVEGYGEPKRFDPDTKTHHHFRCTKCSKIIDIHHKYFDNIRIPQDIQKRFTVLNKKVVLEGVCERCGKKRRDT